MVSEYIVNQTIDRSNERLIDPIVSVSPSLMISSKVLLMAFLTIGLKRSMTFVVIRLLLKSLMKNLKKSSDGSLNSFFNVAFKFEK